MRNWVVFALCLAPALAQAQSHGPMMHAHHGAHAESGMTPTQPGQGAFAAIAEIVAMLQADPKTDWSKVDIDGLRQHLVDMDQVTILAQATSAPLDDGMRFEATGAGAVRDSIRRMLTAHAAVMNGAGGWRYEAAEIEGGASLAVHVPPADREKLRALGLFGVLALGMHHQAHHLMLARGLKVTPAR